MPESEGDMARRLIVGLGNPGAKYARTRHNIGFMVVDELARQANISLTKRKFNGVYGTSIRWTFGGSAQARDVHEFEWPLCGSHEPILRYQP